MNTLLLRKYAIPIIGFFAVVVIGSLAYQHFTKHDTLSPGVRDSIAVLLASRTSDSIAHANAVAKVETLTVKSEAASAASRVTERSAQRAHALGDSLAAAARIAKTAQDSAAGWHAAYDAEHQRGDSLQVALTTEHAAADEARASAKQALVADSLSQFRLKRVEALNVSLVDEAKRLSAGCHLLPFVRCLTRKETAIGVGLVTYGLVKHYEKAKP